MKISIDKSRFAVALLIVGALIVICGLVWVDFMERGQVTMLQIKLHPVVTPKVSTISIAPTSSPSATPKATPTAKLKYNPKTGVVK